jgi:hypothetical protein
VIGGVLAAIRDQVAVPQETVPTLEARAWFDPDGAPLGAQLTRLEVVGLTTTPMNPQIGAGFGGTGGGVMQLRHLAALVLTVEDASVGEAVARRDLIVTDLVRRAVGVDWINTTIAPDQDVQDVTVGIEYADLESDTNNAYATVTFTVDTEWRL